MTKHLSYSQVMSLAGAIDDDPRELKSEMNACYDKWICAGLGDVEIVRDLRKCRERFYSLNLNISLSSNNEELSKENTRLKEEVEDLKLQLETMSKVFEIKDEAYTKLFTAYEQLKSAKEVRIPDPWLPQYRHYEEISNSL